MKIIEKIRALALVVVIMTSFAVHAEDLPSPTTADSPLTVLNVIIDKTDKNAVIARSAAILDAKRVAFQMLAERNLTPEQMKDFKLPEDPIISRLVQDFEIADEQISATRYVANFTVRFQKTVNDYLKVNIPDLQPARENKTILVLPYYETIAGKKLLWEDGNPWMTAWKSASRDTGGIHIVLPLGDIDDVGAGDSAAVWSDNYIAIEKLRSNYGADQVLLTVANLSGLQLTVDAYTYKDSRLLHVDSFPTQTAVSGGGDESFKTGVDAVLEFLRQPPPSQPETPDLPDAPDQPDQASSPSSLLNEGGSGPVLIDAEMNFDSFAKWVDAQKRLAAVVPPIKVEIKSISSGMATFTLGFSGNFTTLKSALAEKNITFSAPVIEVDETALDAASTPQKTVYTLHMAE